MFFRRERPKVLTFEERLDSLRQAGFAVAPDPSGVRVSRGSCAIIVQNRNGQPYITQRAGILMRDEIGVLVDGGFQKFFQAPSGARKPALAGDLKALHDFEEDLKEALQLPSLYNESLGTVSTLYLYDRVQNRDAGVPKRVWEQ